MISIYTKPYLDMASKSISKSHQKRLEYLSTYFRELRFADGLTQREVSEDQDLDLHLNTLIRAENSKTISLLTLFKLADYYEIDVQELFHSVI
jgi:transcriptional regulator with XRE-family HTH domain